MSKGPIHIPPSPLSSHEALAQLRGKDAVDVELGALDLTRRSREQMAVVSGLTQSPPPLPGAKPPPFAPKPPAPPRIPIARKLPESSPSLAASIEEIEPQPIEDLEITPNLANRRADTLPEWMRPDFEEPARELAPVASAPSLLGRAFGVAALALVAAGAWWFAADGFSSLQAGGASVVAASPALAAAPQEPLVTPPAPAPVAAAEKFDAKVAPVAQAPIKEVEAQLPNDAKAAPARRASRPAPNKGRVRLSKPQHPLPAAPKSQAAASIASVQGLMVGAAGSGRSCRSVGNTIAATEHERVNFCFKIRPAKGMRKVVVQWRHNGKIVRRSEHGLPSSPGPHAIRAFSRVESGQSGAWTVQLRTESGQILASKRFSVGM